MRYILIFLIFLFISPAYAVDSDTLIALHNLEREKAGLHFLNKNVKLMASASNKARVMFDTNCWSHSCPEGIATTAYIKDVDYDYLYMGENLAKSFKVNEDVIRAWLGSPGHKKNLLSPKYNDIGIAVLNNYHGVKKNALIVVHFGTERRDLRYLMNEVSKWRACYIV